MHVLPAILHSVKLLLLVLLCFSTLSIHAADKKTFKPFVLAEQNNLKKEEVKAKVEKQINESPFSVVAEYSPYDNAYIYIISSEHLKSLAAESHYGGFAAAQRISLTRINDTIQVAYTNPVYMQYAFRLQEVDMQPVLEQMKQSFGFEQFFGGDGLTAGKLKRYKYSFGLEDFDSFYELPQYDSHVEAITALIKGFNQPENGISKVYELKVPGKEQVVFGVSMSEETSGDEALNTKKTMTVVDHFPLKRTAYLPYEIMVDGNQIIALHARFRIAAYFYDLKMFGKHGFGKLFSTPNAYLEAFTQVSGGSLQKNVSENGFINY
ncbi:MAG: hypothetical protein KZQ64_10995 [gamma proteobacterium symbiont of Bathyaustriella thionipta]|nr:hypothetical protein [gamma proteobacterium symbiont of Bathyaustriella thionipta]MCU7950543.1 hypothetical protein [gamma proteobacterium symbiont of Bathyaustriella thionipta]MCU7953901.1 hypothetical protein [gamma proteobacterium symbiont of Bathyaustriella thionipta]MCU7957045.1 hypothetical protein [gamma proteobacterium symbiont of Bathyaustriella thionipta]MCU7965867.1 hypothetical protein [gamma proteobacterium symbiont of Bathyaustriella thionipta]